MRRSGFARPREAGCGIVERARCRSCFWLLGECWRRDGWDDATVGGAGRRFVAEWKSQASTRYVDEGVAGMRFSCTYMVGGLVSGDVAVVGGRV